MSFYILSPHYYISKIMTFNDVYIYFLVGTTNTVYRDTYSFQHYCFITNTASSFILSLIHQVLGRPSILISNQAMFGKQEIIKMQFTLQIYMQSYTQQYL